jgi:hypothetical protein
LHVLAVLGAAVASDALTSDALTCSATATTLTVSWPAVDATDLYYIALSEKELSRPFALQTSPGPSTRLIDLVPSTQYYLSLRSHPSSEQIVWGWRPSSVSPVLCTTTAERVDAPHALRRTNASPSERSIGLIWKPANQSKAHSIGIRVAGESEWQWDSSDEPQAHTWHDLKPGESWEAIVRDERTGMLSEMQHFRTATAGSIHTTAYRIAEFVFEPDFLENHDAASKIGMPTYIQNGEAVSRRLVAQIPPANFLLTPPPVNCRWREGRGRCNGRQQLHPWRPRP